MKKIAYLGCAALALILAPSCSVSKRVHMAGYHVEWHKKKNKSGSATALARPETKPASSPVTAQAGAPSPVQPAHQALVQASAYPVVKRAGIKALVLPAMRSAAPLVQDNLHVQKDQLPAQQKKKELATSAAAGGKSQVVAFLLSFFLGGLGVDRFYLGYVGLGVLKLLTVGGFGIWWLIDWIMILAGALKPKNGDYETKM